MRYRDHKGWCGGFYFKRQWLASFCFDIELSIILKQAFPAGCKMKSKKLTDIVDKTVLFNLLSSFSKVTGLMTKIVGPDGEILVPPIENSSYCRAVRDAVGCKVSYDKMTKSALKKGKSSLYYCHLNIWHFASPILINNVHYGTIIGGQFLSESPRLERIEKHASAFEMSASTLQKKINTLPENTKHSAMLSGDVLHSIATSIAKLCLKNQEFISIFEASKEFYSLEDKNEIIHLILRLSCGFIKAELGKVFLLDEQENILKPFIQDNELGGGSSEFGEISLAELAVSKKCIIFGSSDMEEYSKYSGISLSSKTKSFICVPLCAGKKICGVLQLEDNKLMEYTKYELDILQILASHCGIAVKNAKILSSQHDLIFCDELTKIYNRRYLNNELKKEVQRSSRYRRQFALMFIDIDDFKHINDNYGHKYGDCVLFELAQRVNDIVRDVNIVGRYGGEEFLIIVPECNPESAEKIAVRLLDEVRKKPFEAMNTLINVTISIGIAVFPIHATNGEDLLHSADLAMYQAKNTGKDRYALLPLH